MSRGNLLPYTMDTTRLRCRLSIIIPSQVSNRSCRFRAAMEFANDSKAVPWHTGLTGFSVGRNLGTVPSDLDSPKATSETPARVMSPLQPDGSCATDRRDCIGRATNTDCHRVQGQKQEEKLLDTNGRYSRQPTADDNIHTETESTAPFF